MNSKGIGSFLGSMILALTVGVTSPAYADDTEIYFSNPDAGSAGQPNVLFILDTSSSMQNNHVFGPDPDGAGPLNAPDLGTRLDVMKESLREIISGLQGVNVGLMRFHGTGGPVLYPIAPLNADASTIEPADGPDNANDWDVVATVKNSSDDAEQLGTAVDLDNEELTVTFKDDTAITVLERVVQNESDDVEERSATVFSANSSDLEILKDGSALQIVGVRFTGVAIPPGATILDASLEFTNKSTDSATSPVPTSRVHIWADNVGNAGPFVRGPVGGNLDSPFDSIAGPVPVGDLERRIIVGDLGPVSWLNIPEVKNVVGTTATPDLSALVQNLVNNAGWASGNAMAFMFAQDPAVAASKDTKRVFISADLDAPPKLKVTYTAGGGAADEQTVGFRFTDINIPQGAKIEEAYLELRTKIPGADAVKVKITGQKVGNAPTFTAAANDLGGSVRTRTDEGKDWELPATTTPEELVQSENIKKVIEEITSQAGWCGGNDLVLFLDAGSTNLAQRFYSYDGSPVLAPSLRVRFSKSEPLAGGANGCYVREQFTQITSGLGDVEQKSDGSMYSGSSDLELMVDGGVQQIGLHFKDIQVPPDAPVRAARLEFTSADIQIGAMSPITIAVQDSAAPDDFVASGNNQVSGPPRNYGGVAGVAWTPEPWSESQKAYQTSDIKTLVQSIVDKPQWDPGDSMVFKLTGSAGNIRRAYTYENNAGYAPRLIISLQDFFVPGAADNPPLKTVRDRLLEVVDELEYMTSTPIVDTLFEGARYFRGEPVLYGKERDEQGTRSEFTRVSHPASYTGGTVERDPVCDTDPNHVLCKNETITGNPVYISPIQAECQDNIIVLLSDGAANSNHSTALIPSMISSDRGSGYSCNTSYPTDQLCGKDLADFLYLDDQSGLDDVQTIKTYTIGFNFSDAFLQDLATAAGVEEEAGGAGKDANVKEFFTASTAAELTAVFNEIFKSIADAPSSQAAPSLSVNAFNRLFHRNDVYFSLFKPAFEQAWIGNVKKYRICSGDPAKAAVEGDCELGELIDSRVPAEGIIGDDQKILGSAQSFWDTLADGPTVNVGGAGGQVPDFGQRVIYTYTGTSADLTHASNALTVDNPAITPALFGLDVTTSAAARADMINWTRGQDVDNEDKDFVDVAKTMPITNENRWAFGDPLHGGPLPVTFGGTDAKPVIKIFVGANDGSLRMIDAETGHEDWVFFPPETLAKQPVLRDNDRGTHIYGLDGTPSAWVSDLDRNGIIEPSKGDHVYLYIGMRSGGRNYYALDVTPTADVTPNAGGDVDPAMVVKPKLLWTIAGGTGDFAYLGETWSKPKVTEIRVTTTGSATAAKTVLIFGGGYDNELDNGAFQTVNQGNAIYVVDAETGERLWWASHGEIDGVAGSNSHASLEFDNMRYAIPSDIALLDSNGDGQTDRLYVGDTGGQVWRIDLGDQIGANSPDAERAPSGGRIAVLSDPAQPTEQRKFFFAPDVLQVKDHLYSDQTNYDLVTIMSGDRANPLEKVVHNRAYAIRDYNFNSRFDELNQEDQLYPLTHGGDGDGDGDPDFFDATSNLIQVGSDAEQESATTSLRESDGWFIDLSENGTFVGEKALASPIILSGILFFTTYLPLPPVDPCAANVGIGRLFAVNALNAAAVFQEWGGENDALETADRVYDLGAGIPSAAVPIFQKKGITLLVGSGGGATSVNPNINLPRVKTFWTQD